MKNNSKDRRLAHRASLRKLAAGELNEADTKAVQAAEKARKDVKPAVVLNRKQRKNKRHAARAAK